MNDLLVPLERFESELALTEAQLSDGEIVNNQRKYVEVVRRHKELAELVAAGNRLRDAQSELEAAAELLELASDDERATVRALVDEQKTELEGAEEAFRLLLLPKDPNSGKNVFVEIRGAEGGEEANLFAADLVAMYRSWAASRGWRVEAVSTSESALGGVDEVILSVVGDDAWTRLRHEAGPHRVQRVPVTEAQGRVHTSSATVVVHPEAEEADVEVDPNDVRVDVYRSAGAGGQHVNTTDSAVRVVHEPTGLVVTVQDARSQHQNRDKAMRILRSRLADRIAKERADEAAIAKRAQVGSGGRGEKIRTYNFKENRVTDHRIGLTLYNLDRVLQGELDEVSDALLADERARLLLESGENA